MKQVCIIHGGSTFESYDQYLTDLRTKDVKYERLLYSPDWKPGLAVTLQAEGYDVLMPGMPCKQNAQYSEWTLLFDKIVPFLQLDTVLIGHSLGGIFLAKYLSSYPEVHAAKLILLAAPYDDETDEALASFKLTGDITPLAYSADEIHLFHSEDDPVVRIGELHKFQRQLPSAVTHLFTDRSHFFAPDFPELLAVIRD